MPFVLQCHTEYIAVGVPGDEGEGEVGVVFRLGVLSEDAARFGLVRAFHPHADLPCLVGHEGIALVLRGKGDASIVALCSGALDLPVAFRLLAFFIGMVHHVVVLVPVGEQLAVAHARGVGDALFDSLRRARAVKNLGDGPIPVLLHDIAPERVSRVGGVHR